MKRSYRSSSWSRRWRFVRGATRVLLLTIGLGWVFLPYLWLLSTAFKNQVDAFALPPTLIFTPTVKAFGELFSGPFAREAINSVILTGLATGLALVIGVPAGYGL